MNKDEKPILLVEQINPQVTMFTLNRPEKRNALNVALLEKLSEALEETYNFPEQRVLIFRGAGPVFCAGLDLTEAADHSKDEISSHMLARAFSALYTTPLVTIALHQGAALAGGAGLLSACDFVIAEPNAVIGYPETRRGLVAALVMSLLYRQLHQRDIHELLYLGESISAERAKTMGLINRIVPAEELLNTAIAMANLVIKGAPSATAETKRLLDALYFSDFGEDVKKALKCHHKARQSDEAKEGIAAFLEKREPDWSRCICKTKTNHR